MKTSKKALNQKAVHELGINYRKEISERPIIPCTKTIPSRKDKLRMRRSKENHRDLNRRILEGLSDC